MRGAAKELEFERAAALRDEIQDIRLRVLDQDQASIVGRAAEQAARASRQANTVASITPEEIAARRAAPQTRPRRRGDPAPEAPAVEVTSVAVLPAEEEPVATLDGVPGGDGDDAGAGTTASDWLPGIRDEHDDDGGWQARWLDRPTWDHTVTPNVIHRSGTRPPRSGRRRR